MTALYNRYRPQNLAGIIGQEHVTRPLAAALDKGQTHHAYLLSGPRGCGKTSTSRIVAKSLNCVTGPTSTPCEQCDPCKEITNGTSLDVTEIDAASNGGVDSTRELRQKASTKPSNSRYRIFIIDEAHMVTVAGFNALLKVVEEPPPFLKFIFATTEPEKVIGTIKSRTFQYPFRLVGAQVMTEHLKHIVGLEDASVEEDAYPLIVRAGAGSVRDTLSTLDQLLQGANGNALTAAEAVSLLGLTDSVLLDEAVNSITSRDGGSLFSLVDKVANSGLDPRRFAGDVLERMRDILILKTVPGAVEKGLLGAFTPAELTRMHEQAERANVSDLTRSSSVFNNALADMRNASNPRLSLELAIAELVSGEDERLARLEKMVAGLHAKLQAGISAPAPLPPAEAAPIVASREPEPEVGDPQESSAPALVIDTLPPAPENPDKWADVVKEATRLRKAVGALLGQYATVVKLENGEAVIEFPSEGLKRRFETQKDVTVTALNNALGGSWTLQVK